MRTALLLLAAVLISAADIELALSNGRTVRGELVSEADEAIVLRTRFPVRGGVKQVEASYAKADVLRRKELPTALQQYEERAARTPDTVPEQCTLAQWAYENCLREQARTHALRVLGHDPENHWAKRILDNCGYIEVDGKWVDEAPYLEANNLVRVDGEILATGVAEARRDYQRAGQAHQQAVKRRDDARAIAEGRPRSAAAAEAKAKAKAAEATAEAAGKAIEAAEARLQQVRAEASTGGSEARRERQTRIAEAEKALATARTQQRDARAEAEKAKRTATQDASAGERARATLPDLEAAVTKAAADLEAAAKRLPADDPLLAAKPAAAPAPAKAPVAAPGAVKRPTPPAAEAERPQSRRLRSAGD